ncbi:hypothetical protein NDU88_008011 [Pleurodeles waltl]|uniref:Uncharacterized protein n=1 Tax=Pleurodeles waltl TaxID=8319 RepID=A0AAV7PNJ6_PLEWA|nr:hypothetical protein NDU88_008011 [Pleurodeles waltl]
MGAEERPPVDSKSPSAPTHLRACKEVPEPVQSAAGSQSCSTQQPTAPYSSRQTCTVRKLARHPGDPATADGGEERAPGPSKTSGPSATTHLLPAMLQTAPPPLCHQEAPPITPQTSAPAPPLTPR